jgi:hypothetical protein
MRPNLSLSYPAAGVSDARIAANMGAHAVNSDAGACVRTPNPYPAASSKNRSILWSSWPDSGTRNSQ